MATMASVHQIYCNDKNRLLIQCAPLLAGIRISSLLVITKEELCYLRWFSQRANLRYRIICTTKVKNVLFIFHESLLAKYLNNVEIQEFLHQYGYHQITCHNVIDQLALRYKEYRFNNGAFPHEIGVLLGYPLIDVLGYVNHQGKEALLQGYWKVYGDVEVARDTFEQWDKVKDQVMKWMGEGKETEEIVKIIVKNEE